jgi:hypothetical protein
LLALAAALAGCATTAEKLAARVFAADKTIVYDRGSDLLPPEGLRVTSNADRQISLAWDPVLVGDVAGYAILRTSSVQGAQEKRVGITNSRFGTVFTDTGDEPGRSATARPTPIACTPTIDRAGCRAVTPR